MERLPVADGGAAVDLSRFPSRISGVSWLFFAFAGPIWLWAAILAPPAGWIYARRKGKR